MDAITKREYNLNAYEIILLKTCFIMNFKNVVLQIVWKWIADITKGNLAPATLLFWNIPGDEVITMRSEILIPLVARSSGIMILAEMGVTDPCYYYDEATISRTCAISVLINDVKYIVS